MNAQSKSQNNRVVAGIALVAIGLLALVGQFVRGDLVGMLILPTLGVIFLAWGLVTRTPGLLIPGGILSGLGLGTVLIMSVLTGLEEQAQGAIFFLCMGLGFAVIMPLAWFSAKCKMWWTLIVGALLVLFGIALMVGGVMLDLFQFLGNLWPLVLVAVGLWILYKARKQFEQR